jgi:Xaa-Pro aminopeptidase
VLGARYQAATDSARRTVAEGLARLGLVESAAATYDCGPAADRASRQCPQAGLYFMHGLGHGIGLEVHDPEQAQLGGVIAPGSAFTIEPGVYVRERLLEDVLPDSPRNRAMTERIRPAVRRYANIGVRIEDDYVATAGGVEWVSRAPREAAEVEAAMRAGRLTAGRARPRDRALVEGYRAGW